MTDQFVSKSYAWVPRDGVYARVSTLWQGEKGTSLESQVQKCIEASQLFGGHVDPVHIWRDMESGMTMNRDGLQRSLAAVANREIDRLFFSVPDRLSRVPFDTLLIVSHCEAAGCRFTRRRAR